jgi:hypothetical protein
MKFHRIAATAALCGASVLADAAVTLQPIDTYRNPVAGFDEGAAEIVAFDAATQRIFVVNAQARTVDVLDASDPASLTKVGEIDATSLGASANSVAARDGLVAVAIEADPITDDGLIAFYDAATLDLLTTVAAGALPDAVAFSNTGHFVISSNEGQPEDAVDPEGSVTIVDVRRGPGGVRRFAACTAGFDGLNGQRAALLAAGVKIDPASASVAQDLEPEYAAARGNNAYVTLQENNAIAVVQMNQCRVARILPLGAKNYGLAENSLDTSNREISGSKGRIQLRSWANLYGLFQPDSIAAYETADGEVYLVTANEGDARDADISRVEDLADDFGLALDETAFPPALDVTSRGKLGRLNVIPSLGDLDGDGDLDRLFAFGARSLSIFTSDGQRVFDSGNDFESIIANKVGSSELAAQAFNANNDNNAGGDEPGVTNLTFDSRSDDKGPEPEGVAVGRVGDRIYAFVGLERIGGVMIYDVTDPRDAFYVDYVNNRNFDEPVCTEVYGPDEDEDEGTCKNGVPNAGALDLGPEGLAFVPAADSPSGRPLLIVGNEISGSTTVYEVVATD